MNASAGILLASGSGIRAQILRHAGIRFRVLRPDEACEPDPLPNEKPETYVKRASEAKALNVSERRPQHWVLAADQVVVFENRILRKVKTPAEARERLVTLSGKKHDLLGAWCLARQGKIFDRGLSRVRVELFELSPGEIRTYVAEQKPMSSVACYFLESKGIRLVKSLRGSYHAGLGLPLLEVQAALRRRGL